MCDSMSHFFSKSEVSSPISALFPLPERTCSLVCLNPLARDTEVKNVVANIILEGSGSCHASLCFSITVKKGKGNELVAVYEIEEDDESNV